MSENKVENETITEAAEAPEVSQARKPGEQDWRTDRWAEFGGDEA